MELAILNKKLAMDSRDIAKLTHKRHADVMRDIRDMLEKMGAKMHSSFESKYFDTYGREKPCYKLPHRELLILLTGYSVELRTAVIDRWAYLEKHYQTERKKAIETRNDFTDTLQEHGYTKQHEYIQTTQQMKKTLGIVHKKAEMTTKELVAIKASEALATVLLDDEQGFNEVNPVCVEASEIVVTAKNKRLTA